MQFLVYSIKDDLRNMFQQPVYFKTAINNNKDLKYNSSDFSFWKLGSFDDETGEFKSEVSKEMNGRSVLDA